ncbi:hypothetical protein Moror_8377 [Moniliophthora roreri MCA 2997]|uniref:Uncharacterized protein n=2 Tax=Moniliophthora roreri TaxID=221103 RepID=V2XKD4_MONRO|nr:hypothetical protein Moror_8377 [Moniliophthora roreri MCA 2997]
MSQVNATHYVPIQTSSGSVNALVMPEEGNFKPNFLFGQPLLAKQSTIHFPGMGYNAVFMESERAEDKSGVTLRIEPLIGTADKAIYLRLSDIKKLGLEDTGKEVITRQGKCKIYQGDISFKLPDDYNAGAYTYRLQYAYGLSPEITDHIQADYGKNNKKQGYLQLQL